MMVRFLSLIMGNSGEYDRDLSAGERKGASHEKIFCGEIAGIFTH
tara:strand:+ start:1317 stop:1451 length:135 start_codon:yes stop_codon:yes gene_type:complete